MYACILLHWRSILINRIGRCECNMADLYATIAHSICEQNAFYTYDTHSILINGIGLCECVIWLIYMRLLHTLYVNRTHSILLYIADLYTTIAYPI